MVIYALTYETRPLGVLGGGPKINYRRIIRNSMLEGCFVHFRAQSFLLLRCLVNFSAQEASQRRPEGVLEPRATQKAQNFLQIWFLDNLKSIRTICGRDMGTDSPFVLIIRPSDSYFDVVFFLKNIISVSCVGSSFGTSAKFGIRLKICTRHTPSYHFA